MAILRQRGLSAQSDIWCTVDCSVMALNIQMLER